MRTANCTLNNIAQTLQKEKSVEFAYAYGSFLTRKDARDIDIAVFLKGNGDHWMKAQEIAGRLENALSREYLIDAHLLNSSTPALAFEVISKGRVLFERKKDDRLNWEARTLSFYQDIRPMLQFHDRKFLSA
ncbi:MAG: nucleotidyltransferase domain-containing protein [bacterium]